MIITLEKNAIVFKLKDDSFNLKPLLHFVNNNFQRVKNISGSTLILHEENEEIKKKYLLKWAYKVYQKNVPFIDNEFFERLIVSFKLPIQIITSNPKAVAHTATITINQLNSYEISVSCNQNHNLISQYFKMLYKDAMVQTTEKTIFRITIQTKNHLTLLKNILSKKEILNIPVIFKTYGLSFKRLYNQEIYSVEYIYKEKLKKSYKVLNVSNNTTVKELKNNYKSMLKKYHPDRVYNQDEDTVKLYTRRFQIIQDAYEVVMLHHKIA